MHSTRPGIETDEQYQVSAKCCTLCQNTKVIICICLITQGTVIMVTSFLLGNLFTRSFAHSASRALVRSSEEAWGLCSGLRSRLCAWRFVCVQSGLGKPCLCDQGHCETGTWSGPFVPVKGNRTDTACKKKTKIPDKSVLLPLWQQFGKELVVMLRCPHTFNLIVSNENKCFLIWSNFPEV